MSTTPVPALGIYASHWLADGRLALVVDWDLEDWLLCAGESVERKSRVQGDASLTPAERLLGEVWLFDMETRNGGVSQFFGNHGLARWQALCEAWSAEDVPSLGPIIAAIGRIIAGSDDPYLATLNASPGIEDLYESHQAEVKTELKRWASAAD
ncbi:MAG: DMP19 family protein [Isosphaeraceae bacterium]